MQLNQLQHVVTLLKDVRFVLKIHKNEERMKEEEVF